MKKLLTLFRTLCFSFSVTMPAILLADMVLQYGFDIKLVYGKILLPWLCVALAGLYVFFSSRKIFAFLCCCIISSLGIIFYNFKKDAVTGTKSTLKNSPYVIAVTARYYSIIKDYGLAEKTVAIKQTNMFFDANAKSAVNSLATVKLIAETTDSLYLEINAGKKQIERLRKRDLWEKD